MELNCDSERFFTCSFTGYRPSKLPFAFDKNSEAYHKLYDTLKTEILLLIDNGVRYFQTGMALGIDLMCGEIILELKRNFDIHLFCVIPCQDQYFGWKQQDIDLYNRLMNEASGITYTSTATYARGCMMKRNCYLVDSAQYILAVFDGQKGGTMSTVEYAKKKRRNVILINPNDYTKIKLLHGDSEGVGYV